jgi:predicted oxidoreductase
MRQSNREIYGENWTVPRCYYIFEPLLNFISVEHKKIVGRGDIQVLTNTTATDLLQNGGRIVGVKAKGKDDRVKEYIAGAVILCTGGFGGNVTLVRKYNLPKAETIVSGAPAFATGDGLIMCERVSAKLVNVGYPPPTGPSAGGVSNPDNPTRQIACVNTNKYPGAIWVDNNGKRIVNEDCGSMSPRIREALANAPGQTLVVILDQKIKDENDSIFTEWPGITQARSWQWFDKKADEGIIIKKASTIEELGRIVGVNTQNLRETITKWNGYVAAGKDLEFDRKDLNYKIENPPYYAIRTACRIVGTSGGPAVDVRQRVLDATGRVIPGLYAAGEVSGFQGYGTGYFNMGNIIFGRQAGRMAAWDVLHLSCLRQ